MSGLDGKRILVTGCCGTVGSELVRQLLSNSEYAPEAVIGVDNNESELFFQDQQFLNDGRGWFFLADMRDRDKLVKVMRGIDVVFHSAALKHVVLCERSPMEAVQTNILGLENIIHAAEANKAGKVIFTSTDKAVNPTNVMGTSKLMGERLITAANSNRQSGGPIFSSTRFGNVLGSRGSVMQVFARQIAKGGPVTLTDASMTRFIMTIEQSVALVLASSTLAQGGEVFITKMPVIRIEDLASVMIDLLAPRYGHDPSSIQIETIGSKPGEKLYEELMSHEETKRALELDRYFVVTPAFKGFYRHIAYEYPGTLSTTVDAAYNSENHKALSREELKGFVISNGLLDLDAESYTPAKRYFPGEKEERSA